MKIKTVLFTSIVSSLITLLFLTSIFAITSSTAASPAAYQNVRESSVLSKPVSLEPVLFDPDILKRTQLVPQPDDAAAAGTSYLHLAGSTFVPLYYDTNPFYDTGGCVYSAAATSAHAYVNYSLALPYQSTITQIRLYYKDTNTSSDLTLRLRQMDDGLGFTDIGIVSSVGSVGYGNVTIDLNHTLDYVNFSYVLQVAFNDFGNDMEFCGARIGYLPPSIFGNALPLIQK